MTNETKAWLENLKSEGNLSDEAFNQLKASMENNSKADEFVKGSVLRQSDYSRQSADVQKAKKDAEDALRGVAEERANLAKFQGELGTWQAGAQESYKKALKDKEDADNRAAKTLARLSTVAAKYGIAEDEIKLEDVVIPEKTPSGGPKYATEEDIRRIAGGGLQEAGILDAMIHDLSVEHQRLFGEPLRGATTLVREALAANVPLTKYYADKYKVADREKALSEETYQARLKQDVEAEVAKRMSNAILPGGNGAGGFRADLPSSPVFQKKLELPSEEGLGVSAAVAAFNAGKHKAH